MKLYFISPLVLQKLIWIPTRILLFGFGHMKVSGMEHLAGLKTNVIFAVNHASEFDVFPIPGVLPFFSRFSPIFYTSREKSFYVNSGWRQIFYGGLFFKAWGSYPVRAGLHNYEESLKNQTRILNDGGNLCIFPEGRRTPDGRIHEGKGGVVYLSNVTKKPIVPVRLVGTYDMKAGLFFTGKIHLSISFGAPIYDMCGPALLTAEECKSKAQEIMEVIRKLTPG